MSAASPRDLDRSSVGGRAQGSWWPTDALRLVAVASVPAAWALTGFASGAVMLLVLGASMLIRILSMPQLVDAACQIVFLAIAWAAVTDLYLAVRWVDIPAHAFGTAAAAVIAWQLVVRFDPAHATPSSSVWSTLWHLASLAAIVSVLWEFGEWAGHTFISRDIYVGYDDTIGDLAVGIVAGTLLALPIARRLERG